MATRSEEAKARSQVENSTRRRVTVGVKPVTASMEQKREQLGRSTHRAVHARTKSLADAKAGKPSDGKKVQTWRTGPNGGEDQTTNGVGFDRGRGSDSPSPGTSRPSRKSTRGSWAAGEKPIAPLTSRVQASLHSPEARAMRRK